MGLQRLLPQQPVSAAREWLSTPNSATGDRRVSLRWRVVLIDSEALRRITGKRFRIWTAGMNLVLQYTQLNDPDPASPVPKRCHFRQRCSPEIGRMLIKNRTNHAALPRFDPANARKTLTCQTRKPNTHPRPFANVQPLPPQNELRFLFLSSANPAFRSFSTNCLIRVPPTRHNESDRVEQLKDVAAS